MKDEPVEEEGNEVGNLLEVFARKKRSLLAPSQPRKKRMRVHEKKEMDVWYDPSKAINANKLEVFATPPRKVWSERYYGWKNYNYSDKNTEEERRKSRGIDRRVWVHLDVYTPTIYLHGIIEKIGVESIELNL